MAKFLDKNGEKLTNFTEYQNTFRRQGAYPLDAYSLFNSLQDAQNYASDSKYAYVGQAISVIENDEVNQYIITDIQGNLKLSGGGNKIKELTITDNHAIDGIEINPSATKIKFTFFGITSGFQGQIVLKYHYSDDNSMDFWQLGNEEYDNVVGEIELDFYYKTETINAVQINYKLGNIIIEQGNKVTTIWKESGSSVYYPESLTPGQRNGKFYISCGNTYINSGHLQIEETFSN